MITSQTHSHATGQRHRESQSSFYSVKKIGMLVFGIVFGLTLPRANAEEGVVQIARDDIPPLQNQPFSLPFVPDLKEVHYKKILEKVASTQPALDQRMFMIISNGLLLLGTDVPDEIVKMVFEKVSPMVRKALDDKYIENMLPILKNANLTLTELEIIAADPLGIQNLSQIHNKLHLYLNEQSAVMEEEISKKLDAVALSFATLEFMDEIGLLVTEHRKNNDNLRASSKRGGHFSNEL